MHHPDEEDEFTLIEPKKWTWTNFLTLIVTWVLLFFTFMSNFTSEFNYFFLGKNIGTLSVMLFLLIDAFFAEGFIKPKKPWTRHGYDPVNFSRRNLPIGAF